MEEIFLKKKEINSQAPEPSYAPRTSCVRSGTNGERARFHKRMSDCLFNSTTGKFL